MWTGEALAKMVGVGRGSLSTSPAARRPGREHPWEAGAERSLKSLGPQGREAFNCRIQAKAPSTRPECVHGPAHTHEPNRDSHHQPGHCTALVAINFSV